MQVRVRGRLTPATPDSHGRRARIARTLTFWLRPEFLLRVLSRFQRITGLDRAVALASSALTAVIPLAVVASAASSKLLDGRNTAERIIDRYGLTGGGATAITDVFEPPAGTSTSLGALGCVFVVLAVLRFTRAVQRLLEETWELKPLGVRNTLNGLLWAAILAVYTALTGVAHGVLGRGRIDLSAALLTIPLSAVFLIWGGSLLTAGRLGFRKLVPFGIVASAAIACYSIGVRAYGPHLFSTYATRYGVIGAVFAMISTLFCLMIVVVASAAIGREVHDELGRIRRGEQPAADEVRRQWDEIAAEARSRWRPARVRLRRSARSVRKR
jgi:membrane protein